MDTAEELLTEAAAAYDRAILVAGTAFVVQPGLHTKDILLSSRGPKHATDQNTALGIQSGGCFFKAHNVEPSDIGHITVFKQPVSK